MKSKDTVVLTGASGWIGSRLLMWVRTRRSNEDWIPVYHKKRVGLGAGVCLDLSRHSLDNALSRGNLRAVVHCAAALPLKRTAQEFRRCAKINRAMDDRIVRFCEENDARLIYCSTGSVYGATQHRFVESSVGSPTNEYARGKQLAEQFIARRLRRYVVLRISAPYGPGQPHLTVLPRWILSAWKNKPLEYFGDGERRQDFVWIDDVVRAILLALDSRAKGCFNVAGGDPITMKTCAMYVKHAVPGCTSAIVSRPRPDPDSGFYPRYSIRAARQSFGWAPRVSFRAGLKRLAQSLGPPERDQ